MHSLDAAPFAAPAPLPARSRVLDIRFTGSGSEYFRIWAVNLLLILVTLGLYIPFAKARRIRYFYANTLVDGQALSFHGDPWKMFRGFVLLVVLMGTYSIAGRFWPLAAFIAFLILCAVWPALWRASLQFRLGNTSWRGLRMRFEGSLKDAYLACAPMYLPLIVFVLGTRLLAPHAGGDPEPAKNLMALYGVATLGAMVFVMLLSPWSFALFKRYQHNGYRIAGQHSQVALSNGQVYLLSLKLIGIWLVTAVLAMILCGVVAGVAIFGLGINVHGGSLWTQLGFFILGLGTYLLVFAIVSPYGAARMQNLAWSGTRSEALQFHSSLRFRDLAGLTALNWLLTGLTLGLYRPFAAVATAKLRLQAVHIDSSDDPADWVAAATAGHADATGEIAGDFFGIDMGL